MSGQLTIMELSVMLTLGAIVSASMQLPDHDTLEGFLLLLCALGFQRGISYPGVRNSKTYDRSDVDRWLSEGLLQIINKKIDRVKLETIAASSNRHTYCLWQKGRIRQLIHALFDIRGQSIIRPKFWKFCEGEIK